MLDMLLKSVLGDVNLADVQQQVQAFANAFGQLLRDVETIKATQATIIERLPPGAGVPLFPLDAPQADNVTEQQDVDKGQGE